VEKEELYLEDTQQLEQEKLIEPPMYTVVILNDDYTTMDFVIEVLQRFFSMSYTDSHNIMLSIHQQGKSSCGVFSKDVAETKVHQITNFSQENEQPLKCIIEKIPLL
jgi:ATP-dependent Clp protease adaptor protein ClpS